MPVSLLVWQNDAQLADLAALGRIWRVQLCPSKYINDMVQFCSSTRITSGKFIVSPYCRFLMVAGFTSLVLPMSYYKTRLECFTRWHNMLARTSCICWKRKLGSTIGSETRNWEQKRNQELQNSTFHRQGLLVPTTSAHWVTSLHACDIPKNNL